MSALTIVAVALALIGVAALLHWQLRRRRRLRRKRAEQQERARRKALLLEPPPYEGELAPEFEALAYADANPDLQGMSDAQLREHYEAFGRKEGRTANRVRTRKEFVEQIAPGSAVLEIGPFANPMLTRAEVRYCDVLDQAAMRERARAIGPEFDPDKVPFIHYVLGATGLDGIPDVFDAVVSSHSIEHQPDLVHHLQQVARRLKGVGGRYFVLVPDKRYCFDRLIAASTIAAVLEAHERRPGVHSLRSVVEHYALTTHNDAERYWTEGDPVHRVDADSVSNAIDQWRNSQGAYIDVHAWQFTPDSFVEIMRLLQQLGLSPFAVERLYPSRLNGNEFWAVLQLQEAGRKPDSSPSR